jgi:hypothetical protein
MGFVVNADDLFMARVAALGSHVGAEGGIFSSTILKNKPDIVDSAS